MAGRLHVEVVRLGGGLEDNMAGGDETDNNQDAEFEDRKLVCMVSGEVGLRGKSRQPQQCLEILQKIRRWINGNP